MSADLVLGLTAGTAAIGVLSLLMLWRHHAQRQAQWAKELAHLTHESNSAQAQKAQLLEEIERLRADINLHQEARRQLSSELSASQARAEERERSLAQQLEQFEQTRTQMKHEFDNLSRAFLTQRDQELRAHNETSIGALLKPLSEKIDGFQHRINQIHGDWTQGSGALAEQIKTLQQLGLSIGEEANNLSRALKGDKKLVGNWGEAQLERTLELAGLIRGEHYDTQVVIKDEEGVRQIPDLVVYLPEGKHVIIDSKVSLIDYEAAVAANDDALQEAALLRHANAVRDHINNLANKRYDQLPGVDSPDFVLMFMPIEPAYIEVMKHHRDLFAYAYQRGVVMVSHSTLMPILRTVSNLWMVERSNAEAREISAKAGDIFNAVCVLAERLQRLGGSLQTVNKRYNDTVTALIGRQGLHGKVERFKQVSQRANKDFPDISTLTTDTDSHQLGRLTDDQKPLSGEE